MASRERGDSREKLVGLKPESGLQMCSRRPPSVGNTMPLV